jgi:hypothetical protein
LPIVINTLLTIAAGVITLIWSGLHVAGVPIDIEVAVRRLPSVVIAACAGAFIWGLYDVLSRYQSVDLSPVSLHFVWWRLLLAPPLGYLLGFLFSEPMKPLMGFVIGAFPVRTLRDYIKGLAKKNIKLDADAHPSEEPTLHKIQGMTKDMTDNLYGEGIQSTAHLAQADPIKPVVHLTMKHLARTPSLSLLPLVLTARSP